MRSSARAQPSNVKREISRTRSKKASGSEARERVRAREGLTQRGPSKARTGRQRQVQQLSRSNVSKVSQCISQRRGSLRSEGIRARETRPSRKVRSNTATPRLNLLEGRRVLDVVGVEPVDAAGCSSGQWCSRR